MKRRWQLLTAVALLGGALPRAAHSQKVDLKDCAKPHDKPITTFTVDLPIPSQRAQSRVLKVFTMLGLSPSSAGSLSNQVEWDSGTQSNVWTGDNRRRRIVATIMEGDADNTTTVLIAPFESNTDMYDQKSAKPLSNRNGGYGGKVWCAARAITDSLHSWADAQKLARAKADSIPH